MITIGRLHHVSIVSNDLEASRHFCFSVNSVAETVATLAEHDVELVAGPRARGDGATQMYVYDPDGHMVELVYEAWSWDSVGS